jgi:hypothetical protein
LWKVFEMQLAQLRAEIAPLFGMSDDTLRIRQQSLYREPALREVGMTGRRTELRDRALTATAATSALLVLTAMLGKTRETTIGPAVVRLWKARCVTPTGNPLERCETLGALLTLLLQGADVRARLSYFELDQDIPHFTFVFNRGSRLVYAPFTPDQWKRQFDAAFAAGELAHISRLPTATLDKVAALIAAGEPEGRSS